MRLAARLSTALGIELVDTGESIFDLVEHAQNRERLGPAAVAERIADVLLAGARERDLACISAVVSALTLWGEADLDDVDSTIAYFGRYMDLEHAALWVDALVEASDFATLEQLVGVHSAWESEEIRAVCFAVLPLGVALDGEHRAPAARALQAIATHRKEHAADLPVVVPRLCELLHDEDAQVAAALALGAIGDRRAVEPLIAALPVVPHAAAWGLVDALHKLQAAEAVPAMVELLLATTNESLRDTIYRAVANLGPAEAANAVARSADPHHLNAIVIDICSAGAARGDAEARRFLERARRSTDRSMRAAALRALGKLDGPHMFDELCVAADDPDPDMRANAVAHLRELRNARALGAFVAALRRGTHTAAIALGELRDARAIPHLAQALRHDEPSYQMDVVMKEAAIEALGDIGVLDDAAWAELTLLLGHRSDHVAHCAALACQQLRPGCVTGLSILARRIERAASSEREVPGILRRLDEIARRGAPPSDARAAGSIADALAALDQRVTNPDIAPVIAALRAWAAAFAS